MQEGSLRHSSLPHQEQLQPPKENGGGGGFICQRLQRWIWIGIWSQNGWVVCNFPFNHWGRNVIFTPQIQWFRWSLGGDCSQSTGVVGWCLKVVELLQSCCEKCKYNSTHCASLSGLLKTNNKQGKTKDNKTTNANEQTRLNSKAHGIINA
ncbi:uncharacterized protein LOC131237431 isoform X1 [Magnolia sinica]|uniref:uncharacterized protein LOC131237431 isoform X1 n=1 Tax=Magnolia sinica TaxID=86752 RepID=UPI00265B6F0C|nr:uncharacterized protein LOC131237431 isoform X1 [Magnolia sinica]